jgi:hypothetical protein
MNDKSFSEIIINLIIKIHHNCIKDENHNNSNNYDMIRKIIDIL